MPAPVSAPKLLIVDDDDAIRELVMRAFEAEAVQLRGVADLKRLRVELEAWRPDALVLDLSLPDGDGVALCRELRAEKNDILIIMVTARGAAIDRVLGLEFGGDDYLTKPFEPRELVARVRNLLARPRARQLLTTADARSATFGPWRLDLIQRRLQGARGDLVILSSMEFRLLTRLLDAPRTVLSREALLPERHATVAYDRTLDVQVSRLRAKLAIEPGGEGLVLTVRSEGYMLASDVALA